MNEDIQATFMHRFTSLARTRLTYAVDATSRRDPGALAIVARDMHSLAGEAGLLGLAEVVPLARSGEDRARKLASTPSTEASQEMLGVLHELEQLVERLAAR